MFWFFFCAEFDSQFILPFFLFCQEKKKTLHVLFCFFSIDQVLIGFNRGSWFIPQFVWICFGSPTVERYVCGRWRLQRKESKESRVTETKRAKWSDTNNKNRLHFFHLFLHDFRSLSHALCYFSGTWLFRCQHAFTLNTPHFKYNFHCHFSSFPRTKERASIDAYWFRFMNIIL